MLGKICSNGLKKYIHIAKVQILRKKIKCKAMVIYTTKLLIDGLSLKIQYFSRAFRMSWSCFLTHHMQDQQRNLFNRMCEM